MDLKQPIAIFDFDGTLTHQDSFLPFLRWTHSQKAVWAGLYRCSPTVISYLLGQCSNRVITEKLLYGLEKATQVRQFLGELSHYYVYAYGDSKADRYVLAIADEPY